MRAVPGVRRAAGNRPPARRALTLRTAGLAVLLLCCAPGSVGFTGAARFAGAAGAAGGSAGSTNRAPGGPAGIALPFDAYRFSAADGRTIARARTLLVAGCLRDHGFTGLVPPADPQGTPPLVAANSRRYGVIDLDVAARYGYHFPPDPGAARRAADYQAWADRLTAPQRRAFEGDGNGGCAAAAERDLRRGIQVAQGWFTPLDFASLDRSAADPRVRAATARWSSCMSGRGMRYASPVEAISDPRWDLDAPTPSRQEVATAVADVRCKLRVHLVATWTAVERELQHGLIAERRTAFVELAGGNARYVANARAVLTRAAGRVSRRRERVPEHSPARLTPPGHARSARR